ncbi:DUF3027 domain-containing protein [Nocardia ninae]|uniref:DUF3027 domain-containing protein n=1 Tax=Nocardia ninae NBRC 108245 TaxID=1210091 RepID=A0A511MT44_9NOCA|nr:hypothetical protein NN4_82840 [Nocardia ninae NBRC 108245]
MSAVSVSESGVRPILADAVDLARRALLELEPAGVGAHLGVAAEDDSAATHRFEATLPGYRGWQWAVVVAAPPEADYATVSESALLPGPDALVAPEFVPWDQRIRPGDLAPGDLLAPPPNDPRLVPGYVANGDPAVDEVATEIGLGRTQVLSLEGREMAAERWYGEFGPDTEMAKAAPSTCGLCGFYLPLAGSLRAAFGVCGNAMGADGHVVHAAYGCGAHSDTVAPTGGGSPLYEAFDDAAVELIPAEELAPVKETPAAEAATEVADSAVETAAAEADATATQVADPAATPAAEADVAAAPQVTDSAVETSAAEADAVQVADTAVETPVVEVEAAATDAVAPVVETPDASVASEAETASADAAVVTETTPTGEAPSAAVTEAPSAVVESDSAAAGDAVASDSVPSAGLQADDEGGSAAAVTESASDTVVGDAVAEGESSGAAEPSAANSAAGEAVVARAADETGDATADAESPVDNSGEAAADVAAQADDAEGAQASSGDEQVAEGAAEVEGRAVESSPQN